MKSKKKKQIQKRDGLSFSASHILLIEDNPDDIRLIQGMIAGIKKSQFKLECVDRLKKAFKRLAKGGIDVILLDLGLPDCQGIDTLRSVYKKAPKIPIVVLTCLGDEKVSVQAIKEGAQDYLIKGQVDSKLLKRTLMYVIERKYVEEALRESEERFRTLVEKSVEAIFLINFNMEFVFWNPAAEKLMGLTTTPTKKYTLPDVPIPDSLKIALVNVAKAALTGKTRPKPYELTVRRIDGNLIDVEVFIGLIKYKGKTHILGTVRDVTERKQIYEKLHYQADLLENVSDAIISTDIDFNIRTWNRAAETMYGWHVYEVMEKSMQKVTSLEFPYDKEPDVLRKLFKKGYWKGEVIQKHKDNTIINVLVSFSLLKDDSKNPVGIVAVICDITERKRAEEDLKKAMEKLQKTLEETVNSLAAAVGKRDPYTASHQQRVTKLAIAIAREMGFSEEQIQGIRITGLLHDIGKISVPAEILGKPAKLTPEEFEIVKSHSQAGYDILKSIEFPWPVAEIVLQHHERINGSGYPQGLSDKDILIEVKILGVADVVEAMCSHRPYRSALDVDKTIKYISQNKGSLFAPEVVDVCVKLFKEKGFRFE